MTTIAILPETPGSPTTNYRAVAGKKQSSGKTPGQALDALTAQLGESENGTLIVVQNLHADAFFSVAQQARLQELMNKWRAVRNTKSSLSAAEQAELEALVESEYRAATTRAAALLRDLAP